MKYGWCVAVMAGVAAITNAAEIHLEARLEAVTKEYVLPDTCQTPEGGESVAQKIRASPEQAPIPPPEVNLKLIIENKGKEPVILPIGGDESQYMLTLSGPGAINADLLVPMTMELRYGQKVKLAPGEHHVIPIPSLKSGPRNISRGCWWTRPGEYKISATFRGFTETGDSIVLEAQPVTVTVKAVAPTP